MNKKLKLTYTNTARIRASERADSVTLMFIYRARVQRHRCPASDTPYQSSARSHSYKKVKRCSVLNQSSSLLLDWVRCCLVPQGPTKMSTRRTASSATFLGLVSLLLSSASAMATTADISTPLPENASLKPDVNVPLCAYTVTTVTGKKNGAGTSSVISLRMENKAGESVFFSELDNGKTHFERGHTDKFDMMGTCVSDLCKMTVYTDDSWDFGDWYVETVSYTVVTSKGSEHRTWDVHTWLPRDGEAAELFYTVDDCHK